MGHQIISGIGVEIEGGWRDCSRVVPWLKGDGSVHIEGYGGVPEHVCYIYQGADKEGRENLVSRYKNLAYCGEIASDPFQSKTEIEDWLNKAYPDTTNSTCGLHIHVSFTDLRSYAALMTQKFYEIFLTELHHFGENYAPDDTLFWNRLVGLNTYCRRNYNPSQEIFDQNGKYRLLNYSHFVYERKRTFECRAFPAFQHREISERAIYSFLNIIRKFLINDTFSEEELKPHLTILEESLKRTGSAEELKYFRVKKN